MPPKPLEKALERVFRASWRIVLPVLTRPVPSRHLARRLRIALVPGPEASTPVWVVLLDGHVGIAISDSLGLPILASPNHKLLFCPRCTPWAVAW